jgi:hypothetical protein
MPHGFCPAQWLHIMCFPCAFDLWDMQHAHSGFWQESPRAKSASGMASSATIARIAWKRRTQIRYHTAACENSCPRVWVVNQFPERALLRSSRWLRGTCSRSAQSQLREVISKENSSTNDDGCDQIKGQHCTFEFRSDDPAGKFPRVLQYRHADTEIQGEPWAGRSATHPKKTSSEHSQKPYRTADHDRKYNDLNSESGKCFIPAADFVGIHIVEYINRDESDAHGGAEYSHYERKDSPPHDLGAEYSAMNFRSCLSIPISGN